VAKVIRTGATVSFTMQHQQGLGTSKVRKKP
jgi:hypothetical protein